MKEEKIKKRTKIAISLLIVGMILLVSSYIIKPDNIRQNLVDERLTPILQKVYDKYVYPEENASYTEIYNLSEKYGLTEFMIGEENYSNMNKTEKEKFINDLSNEISITADGEAGEHINEFFKEYGFYFDIIDLLPSILTIISMFLFAITIMLSSINIYEKRHRGEE
ncbi:MAG: hypothetical protein GWP09_01730 [Nitrospiraceae bacterium]|nr:hypothetical protein [Nitrospiraceae bacterium]